MMEQDAARAEERSRSCQQPCGPTGPLRVRRTEVSDVGGDRGVIGQDCLRARVLVYRHREGRPNDGHLGRPEPAAGLREDSR